jgi:hypothetical protein
MRAARARGGSTKMVRRLSAITPRLAKILKVLVDALERRAKYPAFLLGDGQLIFIHRRRVLFEEPQQQARGPG